MKCSYILRGVHIIRVRIWVKARIKCSYILRGVHKTRVRIWGLLSWVMWTFVIQS